MMARAYPLLIGLLIGVIAGYGLATYMPRPLNSTSYPECMINEGRGLPQNLLRQAHRVCAERFPDSVE